jgi:hypothetical protein
MNNKQQQHQQQMVESLTSSLDVVQMHHHLAAAAAAAANAMNTGGGGNGTTMMASPNSASNTALHHYAGTSSQAPVVNISANHNNQSSKPNTWLPYSFQLNSIMSSSGNPTNSNPNPVNPSGQVSSQTTAPQLNSIPIPLTNMPQKKQLLHNIAQSGVGNQSINGLNYSSSLNYYDKLLKKSTSAPTATSAGATTAPNTYNYIHHR